MSKSEDPLENYPLFFEELGRKDPAVELTKKEIAYERARGLNEDQLAKLSDDIRSPILGRSSDSNPMQ